MKFISTCFYVFLNLNCISQIVYNNDFEIFDTCPTNFSQPSDFQIEYCIGWYAPTEGTSDFFNNCNLSVVSVPQNSFGYETAFNGNGYLGFYANQRFPSLAQCSNLSYSSYYREYVSTRLLSPLISGQRYELEFYISLADTACGYAVRNIGAFFSPNYINQDCFRPLIETPQIKSNQMTL